MLHKLNQIPNEERLLLASPHKVGFVNRDIHIALSQLEQTLQPGLREAATKRAEARPRQHRKRVAITGPRTLETTHRSSDLGWTALDYAAPLACGLSVMLLRRADWLHAAGSASLGASTAATWGIAFTLLTALATAALSRLIGLHNQSPNRTWLHEQGLILLAAASATLGIATTAHLVGAFGLSGQLVALNIGLTAVVMSLSRTLWRRRSAIHVEPAANAKNFTMKILPAR